MTAAPAAVRGLRKRFGDVLALDRVDLEVGPGEVLGLVGPNGAGKTTTMRVLLGFLKPTAGRALVFGADPFLASTRRLVGYCPAELAFDPRHTVGDWLGFCAALRGGDTRAGAAKLCERLDLDPRRRLRDLSTGNRRKAALVAAFAHRPRLLVLDEPTAGLDPLQQRELRALVREAADGGAGVLLSSHVLPEVERLADRIALIRRGRIVTVATLAELRDRARATSGDAGEADLDEILLSFYDDR